MSGAEQIDAVCSALLGGPDGSGDDRLEGLSTYAWTLDHSIPRPRKQTLWSRADQPGSVASVLRSAIARQPDQLAAVYLSMGFVDSTSVADKQAHNRRASSTDIAGIPALWADIDILGAGHKGAHYPPDEAGALKIAHSLELPPSIVLHSGGGLQVYWLLAEPWLVRDGRNQHAERVAMAELSRDLVNTLRYQANRLGGWKVDSVFDLARVMRAPGSLNTKTDPARAVRVLHLDASVRYDPDQLRERMASEEVLAEFGAQSVAALGGDVSATLPGVDLVSAWRAAQAAPEHTPEWMTTLLEQSPGSRLEATWEGTRPDLRDDPSAMDAALVRFLHDLGLPTQWQVEALMARRIRAGQKLEKVDPAIRTTYVVATISRIHELAASASTEAAKRKQGAADLLTRAATATLSSVPPPAPEPEPTESEPEPDPDAEGDPFADYITQAIEPEPEPEPEPDLPVDHEPERLATAREQVRRERAQIEEAPPSSDPWGQRHADVVFAMQQLGELLLPEAYRKAGVQIWRLEERDRGPASMGRLVVRFPIDFDWPGGNRPKLYRVGLPLYCEWWKRDDFETPKAYHRSLERDCKIIAEPVGKNKDEWIALIRSLVPYWLPDSSGSDMTTQMHEWLHEWLLNSVPTMEPTEAIQMGKPLLVNHADWGVRGAPEIMFLGKVLLEFISRQPGGKTGREARGLLDHLHTETKRPRIELPEGGVMRGRWYQISAIEFTATEWHDVLTAAREAMDNRTRRHGMHAVRAGDH